MKIRIALLLCFTFIAINGFSQVPQLLIEGSSGKFYLNHTVVAKENWYSIGRLFNQAPHDIASFNNLSFDKPLDVAQEIKIPLTSLNFDQKQIKSAGESLIPVYHLVGEGEWMFKISSIYNDVPVTSLEKWNKIKRDDVKKGMNLIVGFLRVKTDISPLASGIPSNPATPGNSVTMPGTSLSTASTKSTVTPIPATTTPSVPVQTSAKTAVPLVAGAADNTGGQIPANGSADRINSYATTHTNGGFFSTDYTSGSKSATGLAGTFKSTSGWSDGKYYALMNGVPVGTILRVTGTNGKIIFAKVLGQLPEMKESIGLLIRISNAASAELGLGEGKFSVEVKY